MQALLAQRLESNLPEPTFFLKKRARHGPFSTIPAPGRLTQAGAWGHSFEEGSGETGKKGSLLLVDVQKETEGTRAEEMQVHKCGGPYEVPDDCHVRQMCVY